MEENSRIVVTTKDGKKILDVSVVFLAIQGLLRSDLKITVIDLMDCTFTVDGKVQSLEID